ENDLREGGIFLATMASKDGKISFDFGGTYNEVVIGKKLAYSLGDGRQVEVNFDSDGNRTIVTETFDAEGQHSLEMQKNGWQSILDNFKKYVESN
ncbi:MAG TPA: SRPBCC domain-containing protein, partial [Flavobacterium sp.]